MRTHACTVFPLNVLCDFGCSFPSQCPIPSALSFSFLAAALSLSLSPSLSTIAHVHTHTHTHTQPRAHNTSRVFLLPPFPLLSFFFFPIPCSLFPLLSLLVTMDVIYLDAPPLSSKGIPPRIMARTPDWARWRKEYLGLEAHHTAIHTSNGGW